MALTAARATFRNAIKPVGESIAFDVLDSDATTTGGRTRTYDFLIDSDFVLTKLLATKTVVDGVAGCIVTIQVQKLTKGTDTNSVASVIAQVGFIAQAIKGTTVLAGLGTAGQLVIGQTDGTAQTSQFPNGTFADPLTKVVANEVASGSSPSQQRIRISITANATGAIVTNMSCFIRCDFARFNDTRRTGAEELISVLSSDA